jgi:hypothetical protein
MTDGNRDKFVILNSANQFFAGTWTHIKWVSEYPDARLYSTESNVIKEALKLRPECDDQGIRAIANYGLDTETVLTPPYTKPSIAIGYSPPPEPTPEERAARVKETHERIRNHQEYVCPGCKRCICECYKGQIYDCTPNSSDLMHRVFWNHFKNRFVFVCDDCMDEITRLC